MLCQINAGVGGQKIFISCISSSFKIAFIIFKGAILKQFIENVLKKLIHFLQAMYVIEESVTV